MPRLSCELVAKQRPPGWVPPNMFQLPKVLTEAEVIEALAVIGVLLDRSARPRKSATACQTNGIFREDVP